MQDFRLKSVSGAILAFIKHAAVRSLTQAS